MRRAITSGAFDVFGVGHLNIFDRTAELGGHLTVGVSNNALNFSKEQRNPIYDEDDRMRIIYALCSVDDVFFDGSPVPKAEQIKQHRADVLVMGNDRERRFDSLTTNTQSANDGSNREDPRLTSIDARSQ